MRESSGFPGLDFYEFGGERLLARRRRGKEKGWDEGEEEEEEGEEGEEEEEEEEN